MSSSMLTTLASVASAIRVARVSGVGTDGFFVFTVSFPPFIVLYAAWRAVVLWFERPRVFFFLEVVAALVPPGVGPSV